RAVQPAAEDAVAGEGGADERLPPRPRRGRQAPAGGDLPGLDRGPLALPRGRHQRLAVGREGEVAADAAAGLEGAGARALDEVPELERGGLGGDDERLAVGRQGGRLRPGLAGEELQLLLAGLDVPDLDGLR